MSMVLFQLNWTISFLTLFVASLPVERTSGVVCESCRCYQELKFLVRNFCTVVSPWQIGLLTWVFIIRLQCPLCVALSKSFDHCGVFWNPDCTQLLYYIALSMMVSRFWRGHSLLHATVVATGLRWLWWTRNEALYNQSRTSVTSLFIE